MNIKQIVKNVVLSLCVLITLLSLVVILSWESSFILSEPHIDLIGKDTAFLLILLAWGFLNYVIMGAVIEYVRDTLHAKKVRQ